MRVFPLYVFIVCSALLFFGCLTVDSKEYQIKLNTDHSGEATIRFMNITSETDDSVDISRQDFQQLLEYYVSGEKFEKDNPEFHNIKKRLYESNGMLVGEVSFTFDSLSSMRIFQYDKDCPYMYFAGNQTSTEHVIETNGTLGPQWMPVVYWPKDAREFTLKTKLTSEAPFHRSLLKYYQEWKAAQQNKKKQ